MRYLHVANGTSTTGTIEQAGVPGRTSIWADPLHEGPVPGHVNDEHLLEVRARHLAGDDNAAETVAELRRWRQVVDDHSSYDELVLWYEHDLFDQLNLIQVLTRIGQVVRGHKPVSLICIDAFPGHPRFKGLGELSADELGPLFDTRQAITGAQYELAARAWDAFRADNPQALDALLRTDTHALPFLAAALVRHLEDYPWTRDGLSRTERRVMSLAQAGPDRYLDRVPADARGRDGVLHRRLVVLAGGDGAGLSHAAARGGGCDLEPAGPPGGWHDRPDRHRPIGARWSRRSRGTMRHRSLAWRRAPHRRATGLALGPCARADLHG